MPNQSSTRPAEQNTAAFALQVDQQRLKVLLRVAAPQFVSAKDILAEMDAQHIPVDEALKTQIEEIVARVTALVEPPPPLLLCKGVPPVAGQDGRLEWDERLAPHHAQAGSSENIDYYASRIVTVHAGEVLGKILPPTPGTPGCDVFGQEIPARAGQPARVSTASGCHVAEDGTLLADWTGTLQLEGGRIGVSEGLRIQNVDFNTGHVHAPKGLLVEGFVADLFQVTAGGDIEIKGDVHAADVRTAGNIKLHGALLNHRKRQCLAGRDIAIRMADNSTAAARGNIAIAREAISCDLFAGGKIDCQSGAISGGTLVATGGVQARVLGATGESRLVVCVGEDWMFPLLSAPLIAQAGEIDKKLQHDLPELEMLQKDRRLSPQQKEKLTELAFLNEEAIRQRDELLAKVEALRAARRQACQAHIEVAREIHPGVEIRLSGRRVAIETPLRGPLVMQVATVLNEQVVVAKLTISGNVIQLPSTSLSDPLQGITLPPLPPEPA